MEPITCEAFAAIVEDMKNQCSGILPLSLSVFLVVCMYISLSYPNLVVMLLWQGLPPSSYKSSNVVSLSMQL